MVSLNLLLLVTGDNPYKMNAQQISQRASLLQKYLCDEQKELQALYALQALMVHMEQPASECPVVNLPVECQIYTHSHSFSEVSGAGDALLWLFLSVYLYGPSKDAKRQIYIHLNNCTSLCLLQVRCVVTLLFQCQS